MKTAVQTDLLALVDQILNRPDEPGVPSGEDGILGLPASLTGIEIANLRENLEAHHQELQSRLGREVHLAVALLDLFAQKTEWHTSIDDFCLLKKTALRDLINAAIYDNLTGLYSKNILETRLQEEFRRARRYSLPLSILFIETDAFKNFNDTYGHLEGDRVLAFIGRYIRAQIREVDFPARFGGDEFMVLLPHTGGETAMSLAQRIHAEILEAQRTAGLRATVTISIGVGTMTRAMTSEDQLIEAADRASYKAKIQKNMVWPIVNADPEDESAQAGPA
ncbi:MAG: GGDEF domain-containing protein [bacterium]|nr:GGDEF domain-containing protein [bacterium]